MYISANHTVWQLWTNCLQTRINFIHNSHIEYESAFYFFITTMLHFCLRYHRHVTHTIKAVQGAEGPNPSKHLVGWARKHWIIMYLCTEDFNKTSTLNNFSLAPPMRPSITVLWSLQYSVSDLNEYDLCSIAVSYILNLCQY